MNLMYNNHAMEGDDMNVEVERKFVESFVIKSKRARTIYELLNKDKRNRFIWNIAFHLDRSTFHPIKVKDESMICQLLREEGAPNTCYMISNDKNKDGCEFPLIEGIHSLDYEFEILICIPDKLVFFRETQSENYLLKK